MNPLMQPKATQIITYTTGPGYSLPIDADYNWHSIVRLNPTTSCHVTFKRNPIVAVPANIGTGYVFGEVITLTGGTSSTAATLTVSELSLLSASVDSLGTGYATGDEIVIEYDATLAVASTEVVSATIADAGTGYIIGEVITLSGGTSSVAATITVSTVGAGGEIETYSISEAGTYTVEAANLTQGSTDESGEGATFDVAYGAKTVTIAEAGTFDASATALTQVSTTGSGTGATFDTLVFAVKTVTVSENGVYTALPSNPVSQGSTSESGSSATFTIDWGVSTSEMLLVAGSIEYFVIDRRDSIAVVRSSENGTLYVTYGVDY